MKSTRSNNGDLFDDADRRGSSRGGPLLQPEQAEPDAMTVTALAALARNVLERTFPSVWVAGEVTGWKRYGSSGHCYFALRDANAQIRCVMFRMEAQQLPADPEEGMQVRVLGRLTFYEKKGDVQFVARTLEARAAGGLWRVAFEKLRKQLEAEGLLAESRKRPIPVFPRMIAVVTSPVGAALHDILHVIRRRAPWVRVLLAPAKVQGQGAAQDVARAIRRACAMEPDTIIVGRGGGSMEDLWAFNEEPVARAIAACTVPVISAVGHETDITIADLVADVRAPTPSAAAERAVPDGLAIAAGLRVSETRLRQALMGGVIRKRERVERMAESLEDCMRDRLVRSREKLARLAHTLDTLSPLGILARGYAVAQSADGRVVRRAGELPAGAPFRLRLADGSLRARSEGAEEEP